MLLQAEISTHFAGWVSIPIPQETTPKVIQVLMTAQAQALRLRQVALLGTSDSSPPKVVAAELPPRLAHSQICQAEALHVFRHLTSQVSPSFGVCMCVCVGGGGGGFYVYVCVCVWGGGFYVCVCVCVCVCGGGGCLCVCVCGGGGVLCGCVLKSKCISDIASFRIVIQAGCVLKQF